MEIEQRQGDAGCGEEDDGDEEDEDTQDAGGSGLEALGGLCIRGFDLPVDEKENPEHGKEEFVKREHGEPRGDKSVYAEEERQVPGRTTFRRPV